MGWSCLKNRQFWPDGGVKGVKKRDTLTGRGGAKRPGWWTSPADRAWQSDQQVVLQCSMLRVESALPKFNRSKPCRGVTTY